MFRHGWKLIVLILIGGFAFIWLVKAPIMASYLTHKIGVPVTLRRISMWPSETTLFHFRIANPYGFKSHSAFDVEKTKISYRWPALMQQLSEIDLISLENVILNIEIQDGGPSNNNWSTIGAQMPSKKIGQEVVIHKLVLKNLTLNTTGVGAKKLGVAGTQHFNHMEFYGIDSREGFPTKELIGRIFQRAGLKKYIQKFLDPSEVIKKGLNPFHIFGERTKPAEWTDPLFSIKKAPRG